MKRKIWLSLLHQSYLIEVRIVNHLDRLVGARLSRNTIAVLKPKAWLLGLKGILLERMFKSSQLYARNDVHHQGAMLSFGKVNCSLFVSSTGAVAP